MDLTETAQAEAANSQQMYYITDELEFSNVGETCKPALLSMLMSTLNRELN